MKVGTLLLLILLVFVVNVRADACARAEDETLRLVLSARR